MTQGRITVLGSCHILGISKSTFYRYIKSGKMPFLSRLPSGHIRMDIDSVLALIELFQQEGESLTGLDLMDGDGI